MSKSNENYNRSRFGIGYPFGKGVAVHVISDIRILEFHPTIYEGGHGTNAVDETKTEFAVLGCGRSYDTLDRALAGALAFKYDGWNSQAAAFFRRMLSGMHETAVDASWLRVLRSHDYVNVKLPGGMRCPTPLPE